MVQGRAVRWTKNTFSFYASFTEMQEKVGWRSLEQRRSNARERGRGERAVLSSSHKETSRVVGTGEGCVIVLTFLKRLVCSMW